MAAKLSRKITRKALRLTAVIGDYASKSMSKARLDPPNQSLAKPALLSQKALKVEQGYRVAITGANRGLGLALAEGFAGQGASVAVLCRDAGEAAQIATKLGPAARGFGVDVSDPAQVTAAFDGIADAFGGLDLLINNAGVTGPLANGDQAPSAQDCRDVFDVNVTGAWSASQDAARIMESPARIVNISSGAVDATQPQMGAYAVSKHGIEGVTKQLAQDFFAQGIAVCAIRLGSLRTDMTEKAFGKVKASLLPEPETMLPAFMTLATAPGSVLNGRSFAGWRMAADAYAELYAPTPLTAPKPFAYPDYEHQGRKVDRESRDFRVYDRAENQLGPSPKVAQTLAADLLSRPIEVYPDQGHDRLRTALAESHKLSNAHFAIGNGSWEVLDRILELFTANGDNVVANKPGWFGFNMLAGKRGLNVTKVPMRKTGEVWDHNLDAVLQAVGPTTRLVYLISPSNPEGIVLHKDALIGFLDQLPAGLPVLLDEAYFEYVDDPNAVSAFDLMDRTERPIFGLRTFSKFYALASMRVGYAYGRQDVMDLLNRGERIFNISHLSEKAAITALEDVDWQAHVRRVTLSERDKMQAALREMGLDYIPSQAPYLLLELPADLDKVADKFAEQGIFIGRKSFYKNKFLLLPLSTEEENSKHLDILRGFT